jgi:hypothetical protein
MDNTGIETPKSDDDLKDEHAPIFGKDLSAMSF